MKIVSTKDLTFKPRQTSSKYDPVFEAVSKLKPETSLTIDMPSGENIDVGTFRKRIAAAVRRNVELENGRLTIRVVDENTIAISCLPEKAGRKKRSR